MINKIIDGISVAIGSEFGDEYEIYTESVEQGLTEPCFLISCINPTISQSLGKRYFRTNRFCIYYFPKTSDVKSECLSVFDRLQDTLELITVDGGLIRGTDMNAEFQEDMMNFFVNYDMYVYKESAKEEFMETYEHVTNAKG